MGLQEMQTLIENQFQLKISLATISRHLKDLNYSQKLAIRQPKLTAQQIIRRLEFAYGIKLEIDKGSEARIELHRIIFSDESRFCLRSDHPQMIWWKRGDKNPSPECFASQEKFAAGLMVFGAIGKDFKSNLVFCEGSVDSPGYCANIVKAKRR